jgi:hypothetical protein
VYLNPDVDRLAWPRWPKHELLRALSTVGIHTSAA